MASWNFAPLNLGVLGTLEKSDGLSSKFTAFAIDFSGTEIRIVEEDLKTHSRAGGRIAPRACTEKAHPAVDPFRCSEFPWNGANFRAQGLTLNFSNR